MKATYWNHRVLAHQNDGEWYFQIHEVYYDKNDNPESCTIGGVTVGGDSVEEIKNQLEKMVLALDKPVLRYDSLEEFK